MRAAAACAGPALAADGLRRTPLTARVVERGVRLVVTG